MNSIKRKMLADFEQLSSKRLSATGLVIEGIKELLISGALKVGDRIPNEFEVASAFNVSRGSVRESMKILSAMGVVDVRRGDGTYISDRVGPSMIEQLMIQLVKGERDTIELSEIREIIECGIVRLATKNATKSQIDDLWKALKMQEKYVDNHQFNYEHLIESELTFHKALVKCANNGMLESLYLYVLELYLPARYQNVDYKYHMRIALDVHKPVILAIESKDLTLGYAAIRETTKQWVRIITKDDHLSRQRN